MGSIKTFSREEATATLGSLHDIHNLCELTESFVSRCNRAEERRRAWVQR
jgi:hypothetical protein